MEFECESKLKPRCSSANTEDMAHIIGIVKSVETREDGTKYGTIEGMKSWDPKDKTPLVLDWDLPDDAQVGDSINIPRSELNKY